MIFILLVITRDWKYQPGKVYLRVYQNLITFLQFIFSINMFNTWFGQCWLWEKDGSTGGTVIIWKLNPNVDGCNIRTRKSMACWNDLCSYERSNSKAKWSLRFHFFFSANNMGYVTGMFFLKTQPCIWHRQRIPKMTFLNSFWWSA